jgi:hypothetical protein
MRKFTIKDTPKCTMFSTPSITGQPGVDATIKAVCTACAKCIRANRRRKKLNLDFNPASQKELLLPRQRYGIDFYGVHNGEMLVMVDLFSRETMLEFLPDRKMPSDYEEDNLLAWSSR